MENIYEHPIPRLTVSLHKPLKDGLKIAAVKQDQSLQELVRGILQTWLDEHTEKEVA